MTILERFQSTPPVWEATTYVSQLGTLQTSVSIHASRVGGDALRNISSQLRAFQSTPPVWEATFVDDPTGTPVTFQSTPPVWEATNGANIAPLPACFNPRLPCGRRLEYKGRQA